MNDLPARVAAVLGVLGRTPERATGLEGGIPLHLWDRQVAYGLEEQRRANAIVGRPHYENQQLEDLSDLTAKHGPWRAAQLMDWSR